MKRKKRLLRQFDFLFKFLNEINITKGTEV